MSNIAGRLKYFHEAWSAVTSDRFILNSISGYKIIFNNIPEQRCSLKDGLLNKKDRPLMQNAINDLLRKGAITTAQPCTGQYLSIYFLVQKPNGKQRFVLNLKKLNSFIATDHFKMEDIRTAVKLMPDNGFIASLDLKDAYFLIPFHEESRKSTILVEKSDIRMDVHSIWAEYSTLAIYKDYETSSKLS